MRFSHPYKFLLGTYRQKKPNPKTNQKKRPQTNKKKNKRGGKRQLCYMDSRFLWGFAWSTGGTGSICQQTVNKMHK